MTPRVLVIGAGGLGCPAVLALALEGFTRLTVVDPDAVDASNLHRQLWHRGADVGRLKVQSLREKVTRSFPAVSVAARPLRVTAENAPALFREHDLVIDGTDRVSVKLMLSDVAVATGIPLVHGGVVKLEGMVLGIRPGGPCLRCLFEETPGDEDVPSCSSAGVLGSLAGVVGGLQAEEAVRGVPGTLLRVDGNTGAVRRVKLERNPTCGACGASS